MECWFSDDFLKLCLILLFLCVRSLINSLPHYRWIVVTCAQTSLIGAKEVGNICMQASCSDSNNNDNNNNSNVNNNDNNNNNSNSNNSNNNNNNNNWEQHTPYHPMQEPLRFPCPCIGLEL